MTEAQTETEIQELQFEISSLQKTQSELQERMKELETNFVFVSKDLLNKEYGAT